MDKIQKIKTQKNEKQANINVKYSHITLTENKDINNQNKKIVSLTTRNSRQTSRERKLFRIDTKCESVDKHMPHVALQTVGSNYSNNLYRLNNSKDIFNVMGSYEKIDFDRGLKTNSNFLKFKKNPPKKLSLSKLSHHIQSLKNSREYKPKDINSSITKDNVLLRRYITSTNSPKEKNIRSLKNTIYRPVQTEPNENVNENVYKKEFKKLALIIKGHIKTYADYPRTRLDFYKIGKV
jgi:hypothetical protein